MEEVLKLKELQIRKKIKNSAFRNGIIGFVVVTLFSALDSTTFGEMFSKGLIYGSLGFVVVMLFGNRSWLRLKKKYLAPKYSNLEKLGLDLNQHGEMAYSRLT